VVSTYSNERGGVGIPYLGVDAECVGVIVEVKHDNEVA
jgi:hypothetical protein